MCDSDPSAIEADGPTQMLAQDLGYIRIGYANNLTVVRDGLEVFAEFLQHG